jgi:hypothetical protein
MFEVRQRGHERDRVLADPAVVDETDGDGVEVVELLAAGAARGDQPCSFQHMEVLHDTEPCHPETLDQLGERLAIALKEPVEESPAGVIGERPEDLFHARKQ